jgi:hypothetical protein
MPSPIRDGAMTAEAPPSVGKFALRTFLWLPPCFAAWYFGAQYLAPLVGAVGRMLVEVFASGLVSGLEREGLDLLFVTTIQVHPAPDQTAVLLVDVNPLLYTYGLPFFVALMLAARAKWWKILAGAAVLVPFQGWGIAFDFLAQVVRTGSEISAQAGLLGPRAEVIALAYQIGSLLFPALIPVALWVAFNRPLFGGLVRLPPGDMRHHR